MGALRHSGWRHRSGNVRSLRSVTNQERTRIRHPLMAGRMKTRGQLQPAWRVLSEHLHAPWCAYLDWPRPEPHSGDLSAELMQLTAADYKLTVGNRPGPDGSGSAMQSYAFKRRFRRARFTQPVTSVVVLGRKRIATRPSQELGA